MDVLDHWDAIRHRVNNKTRQCFIASVDPEGTPRVTPIGSLFLTEPGQGFYFEKYAATLPKHVAANPNICVLAMQLTMFSFLAGMARGRLADVPGLRLRAEVGQLREATAEEARLFANKTRIFRFFKGHDLLWSGMTRVRELEIDEADVVTMGPMTRGLALG